MHPSYNFHSLASCRNYLFLDFALEKECDLLTHNVNYKYKNLATKYICNQFSQKKQQFTLCCCQIDWQPISTSVNATNHQLYLLSQYCSDKKSVGYLQPQYQSQVFAISTHFPDCFVLIYGILFIQPLKHIQHSLNDIIKSFSYCDDILIIELNQSS